MPPFQPKRFEQILGDEIASVVTSTDLSDVADSSGVKGVLAATAREVDESFFQMENVQSLFSIDTATGDDLDERAKDIQPGTVVRINARSAVGTVVFSRPGTAGTTPIPSGTRVKTGDGVVFVTSAAGTITPASPEQIPGHGVGRDSGLVPVSAETPESTGNVVGNTIIKFENKPPGVDEVTNPSPTTLGLDKESDDAFRQRLKDFIAGLARCTPQALENGVLGTEDPNTSATILFSKAIEDQLNPGNVTLFVDDGTGAVEATATIVGENVTAGLLGPPADSAVGGETELFLDNKPVKGSIPVVVTSSTRGILVQGTDFTLNPASSQLRFTPALVTAEVITADYTHFIGLIQLAQKVIDGDPTDRENFPGLRAAGVLVLVLAPATLIQTVVAALVIREGFVRSSVIAEAELAVQQSINGGGISDDVVRNEIIKIIQALDGVADLNLTAPANNIAILDDQIARITPATITIV